MTQGILSPPRLPASGGGGLLPLNRPIFEAEGDFSATTEGIPLIFECIISWIFDSVNWIFVKVNISILRAVSSNLGGAVLF